MTNNQCTCNHLLVGSCIDDYNCHCPVHAKPDDDMDEGDIWREHKKERQEKKERNLEASIGILQSRGIAFEQFSPWHIRIKDWDFWPSTGKFWNKITGVKGRGIFNLIRLLNPVRCIECGEANPIVDQCGRCGGPVGQCCPHHEKVC